MNTSAALTRYSLTVRVTRVVKWGKFGDYELAVADATTLAGSAVGNPADWRRMRLVRKLSPAEARLLGGSGHGSTWSFQWAGGAFPVEFKVGRDRAGTSATQFVSRQAHD